MARRGASRGWCRTVAAIAAAVVVAGCGRTGSETTRIDQAEAELTGILESIVDELDFEVTSERPFGSRMPCEQPGLGDGASNATSLRGPVPEVDDPIGRSAAVLVDAGYVLIDDDQLDEGVYGRRDGIRVTVFVDEPLGELAVDAATGCRPLPE